MQRNRLIIGIGGDGLKKVEKIILCGIIKDAVPLLGKSNSLEYRKTEG